MVLGREQLAPREECVSWGCRPQATGASPLTALKAASPKSRCGQRGFLCRLHGSICPRPLCSRGVWCAGSRRRSSACGSMIPLQSPPVPPCRPPVCLCVCSPPFQKDSLLGFHAQPTPVRALFRPYLHDICRVPISR